MKRKDAEEPTIAGRPGRLKRWLRRARRAAAATGIITIALSIPACVRIYADTPSFDLSHGQVRAEVRRLKAAPVNDLERPVVILSGYRAVPSMAHRVRDRLCSMTTKNHDDFYSVAYTFRGDIIEMVDLSVDRISDRFGTNGADETIEVDVVAISMGGLVARVAAEDPVLHDRDGRRLRINRLFTLATPHRGANLAKYIRPDQAAEDVRPGSAFLEDLNSRTNERDYELVCYGQTRDGWVGAKNTAPPGMEPYWTGGTLMWSHFNAPSNPWFLADIARRLRGEEPIALETGAPPRD